MKHYDVAILGAGTAGLAARREVARLTERYVVIDDGPLGTTCARVGCMPSKVLIEVANSFQRREKFTAMGISGAEALKVDHRAVLKLVRSLRDRFVRGVLADMEAWQKSHLMRGRASFLAPGRLVVGDETITADRIIVATGSAPISPKEWQRFAPYFLDTDQIFELEDLPKRVAVIGLGVIGLELGQALARLGVEVVGIGLGKALGGLSDPELQDYALATFRKEFPIYTDGAEELATADGLLSICSGKVTVKVERAFLTIGRAPAIEGLGLEKLGVPLNERGLPRLVPGTFQCEGCESVYFAGDSTGDRLILHEAADEGRIVGHNALAKKAQCFRRRPELAITFSSPNIALVGRSFAELQKSGKAFVVGQASYEGQGRAIVKLSEVGKLRVYADAETGKLLGAEMLAPEGEHLAHLLAWALGVDMTVVDALRMPFYHPVLEEGVRTALRHAASQLAGQPSAFELLRCQDPPVGA